MYIPEQVLKAKRWLMEARAPHLFPKPGSKVEISGPGGGPVQSEVKVGFEELDHLLGGPGSNEKPDGPEQG